MTRRELVFHPITVLAASILAAVIFALFITLFFEGSFRWFLLYYHVPIGIPFIAFLFDRAEGYTRASRTSWAIDIVVLIFSLTRAFVRLPLISGHALFLTYCLLASRSPVVRVTAVIVVLEVAYLKIFVTHDTALIGGVIAGGLAALLYRRLTPVKGQIQMERGL